MFSLWVFFIESTKWLKLDFFDFLNLKVWSLWEIWFSAGENSKTNILIVWRWWGLHDAPNLTDSIILASIDTKQNITSMLSIPRDLLVEVDEKKTRAKINELYTRNLDIYKKTEDASISVLRNKVSKITWQNIDYYINIDFEGFKKFIDYVWWVEVTLEENLVDNEYPDGNNGYTTFVLRKWTWILDGDTALKYARSRHSTSDFDRSLRQQEILSSLKDKVLQEWYLSNPTKISNIYSILREYIKTDIDVKTLISIALWMKSDHKIVSFNLNDSCFYAGLCFKWGFLYVPQRDYFWWLSVLIPQTADVWDLENYSDIQKYADLIFNQREVFEENLEIHIFNGTKRASLAKIFANKLYRYGFNIPDASLWNTNGVEESITTIYYNNIDEDNSTIEALKKLTKAPLKKIEKPIYSQKEGVKVEIVIWEDYASYENNF